MLLLYKYRVRFVTKYIQIFNSKTQHNIENACWINTLYDLYGDNLLSQDKKRNVITRDMILETLGRTEDNIKIRLNYI